MFRFSHISIAATVTAAAMLAAVLAGLFVRPAAAQDTSNYCGSVASTSGGGTVATGYWYTDSNGRRYCRPIRDSANYVCMAAGTRTFSQTVSYHEDAWYTFREVTKRPVPDASSFKPSGVYDPYAVNTGSLSRPVWQSSGARPTAEEQAVWDASFTHELIETFAPGETVTTQPTRMGYTYADRRVRVDGELKYRTVETEVPATVLSRNGNGLCTPNAAAHSRVRYNTPPRTPSSPWVEYSPPVGAGVNEHSPGSFGDATFERNPVTGSISTHSDGNNIAHNRFVHSCVSNGNVMSSSVACTSPLPDPPQTTPTIYDCYAQNYETLHRESDWDPIITRPVGDPVKYTSTSPCP